MASSIHPTIACTFASGDAAIAGVRSLADAGIAGVRVGATDATRAHEVAQATGAIAEVDPADPLAGVFGLASGDDARSGVDRGALIGGAIGVLVGALLGDTPFGALLPVDPALRIIASALLTFAVGVAVGGALGLAFGRRPSTHAGYRLIDAMEEGAIAIVVAVEAEKVDDAERALSTAGAGDVLVFSGREVREAVR